MNIAKKGLFCLQFSGADICNDATIKLSEFLT